MIYYFTWIFTWVKFNNPFTLYRLQFKFKFIRKSKILTTSACFLSKYNGFYILYIFWIKTFLYTTSIKLVQLYIKVFMKKKLSLFFKKRYMYSELQVATHFINICLVLLHLVLFFSNRGPTRGTSSQQKSRGHRLYGMLAYSFRSQRTSSKMANVCGCFGE